MDSITHVVLGAVVGEALAGRRLGKRAMLFGALAQSLPDIDFIASFWLSPAENLLAHRGITHSFLFASLATVALAAFGRRTHRSHNLSFNGWLRFLGIEIFLHLLLDSCNAYGIGWLEPFSDTRFSFHVLFVADPLFSIALGLSILVLIYLDSKSRFRKYWIAFGLTWATIYLAYAFSNKRIVENQARRYLKNENIAYLRIITTPSPFNSWLWFVVVENENGFFTTYRSVFDGGKKRFSLKYNPKREELRNEARDSTALKLLLKFSQGYYTYDKWGDTLVFNDLRFGQIAGWQDPNAKFVFHYYLNDPDANLLVIQRGRFSNWNRETFRSMIKRVEGK